MGMDCSYGDWFVLYQMSKNMNRRLFFMFLTTLAKVPKRQIQQMLPQIQVINAFKNFGNDKTKECVDPFNKCKEKLDKKENIEITFAAKKQDTSNTNKEEPKNEEDCSRRKRHCED